ncbi:helix-turn-helix transcriptional regulator [Halarcobacter anaerophilus]|uniref:Transcriptional regulator n=1 Tax=Halarcobacter anaerophilus TaxID=877500 RepID=A0A4Q0Y2A5_9BACT|nr:WYL domain-containing protein [Halarcobacter anaerophilus]QDF28545.1 transcriptional regulator (WYL domain) [Halarcobacter anaerophilus]RXJ63274.1 transcriptional regulator [Halarcobacter anaerophilus]
MKKHDYDKILYRLTTIWARLREGEILSTNELAIEFNVSAKTIQRDFNERLIHLFPIEKIGHKWRVKQGYDIDKTLDYEDEIVLDILNEFGSSMSSLISKRVNNLFKKISNEHTNPIYSRIEIEDLYDKLDLIKALQGAIEQNLQVEFYHKKKYRYIEPIKITTFEGYWYLYGKDVQVDKLKTFYIKDISNLNTTNKKFIVEPNAIKIIDNAINIWFNPQNKPFEVHLKANANIAKYFIRRPLSKTQRVVQFYDDGSLLLSVYVTSELEILSEVKKWIPNLFILNPAKIVKKLRDETIEFQKKQMDLLIDV